MTKLVLVILFLSGPYESTSMRVTEPIDMLDCADMAHALNLYTVDAEYYCEPAEDW